MMKFVHVSNYSDFNGIYYIQMRIRVLSLKTQVVLYNYLGFLFLCFLLFGPAPLFCKQLKKYGKFYLEFHCCSYICE